MSKLKKVLSFAHIVGGIAAMWFFGEAFYQALSTPKWGMLENCVIAANLALLASVCRDLAK
jgi:hypothetical protein